MAMSKFFRMVHGNLSDLPDNQIMGRRRKSARVPNEDDNHRTVRIPEDREIKERPEAGFEVREGDRLTVLYNGAKLSIAPYNTVDLDGAIYSRTLKPGDDAGEQWDLTYAFLEKRCLRVARPKLAMFADELAKAKKRAKE